MPIDTSIYGQIKQPEAPLDQYGKFLNLRALMEQSKLQQLQTGKLEHDIGKENALDELFANAQPGQTLESLLPEVYRVGGAKHGVEFQGKLLTQQKTKADLEKTQLELATKSAELHREQLAGVDTPQQAAQWVQAGFADPHLAPILSRGGTVQDALARIPTDPAAFQEWKTRNGLGIQKFLELNRPHITTRDTGGQVETVSTPGLGGTPTVIATTPKTATPGEVLTDRRQRELNGILAGEGPKDITPTAQAIANHDIPMPPPPSASRNPMALQRYNELLKKVKEISPDYNAADYVVAQKALKDFATGSQGNSVRSFSVSIAHLDTLQKLGEALKNGDTQLINKYSNMWKEATGQAAPTNFETAKQIVADEVVKAIVGSGSGALGDRQEAAATIKAAKSPEQLAGAINTYKELMNGQLKGLRRQYEESTKRKDFDRFLSDEAKAVANQAPAAAADSGNTANKNKLVATVKNDADFDKLAPGTEFIGPDGKRRRKP